MAVPDGRSYRTVFPRGRELVRPALARELARVLERFAREAGFSPARRVEIEFRPGRFGHHRVGRAADIYGVGRLGMEQWKQRWDRRPEPGRNLGWRLYKSLLSYGRWSKPDGYPVQLFGPWTRTEGPWTRISDFLLRAHRDHIHVAR